MHIISGGDDADQARDRPVLRQHPPRGYDPESDAADYATIIDLVRQQDPTLATVSA